MMAKRLKAQVEIGNQQIVAGGDNGRRVDVVAVQRIDQHGGRHIAVVASDGLVRQTADNQIVRDIVGERETRGSVVEKVGTGGLPRLPHARQVELQD